MKKDLFDRLMNSAEQARDYAAGEKELRTTVLPKPPAEMSADEIVALRESRNVSQAVFAGYLNISPKTA